mgnify:CR=1 FL=1
MNYIIINEEIISIYKTKIDLLLRTITIFLVLFFRFYWYKEKIKSEKNKTIKLYKNNSSLFEKLIIYLGTIFLIINLIGFNFLSFDKIIIQILGFFMLIIGGFQAILARKELKENWTECYDYQIKRNHKVVTSGIYKYVRHPIYGGLILSITGAFMVAKTYIFIPVFLLEFYLSIKFAKREEKILINHFGNKYLNYVKKTKYFFPFIF